MIEAGIEVVSELLLEECSVLNLGYSGRETSRSEVQIIGRFDVRPFQIIRQANWLLSAVLVSTEVRSFWA